MQPMTTNADGTNYNAASGQQANREGYSLNKKTHSGEAVIRAFLFGCAALTILTTIGIVFILLEEAVRFFLTPEVSLWEFFTGVVWQPRISRFGILPLLTATLITTGFAMLVAIPLGLSIAIYLSEYASSRARSIIKPTLEVLAGIPTVVYGYFALTFMTPLLRTIFGSDTVGVYNTASAGIVMGILILPLVATMSEDALERGTQVVA